MSAGPDYDRCAATDLKVEMIENIGDVDETHKAVNNNGIEIESASENLEKPIEKDPNVASASATPPNSPIPIDNPNGPMFWPFLATLAIASYAGALIRVGISYFRIWKIETNYVSFHYIFATF